MRKVILAALLLVFNLFFLNSVFATAIPQPASGGAEPSTNQENNSDRILNLRQQIQELEKQSVEYKEQIRTKQNEGKTLKKELSILESQIAKLRINILITERKVELAGIEIKDLNAGIFEAEEEIKGKKESISGLLREIQSIESRDLASIILANPKISDFFGHLEQINALRDKLVANLNIFLDLKKDLTGRKEAAEGKKQEMEILNRRQKNQKDAREETQAAKNDLLTKTKGQEQKFQQLLTETERKTAEFYTELRKFEEQARKQGTYIVRIKTPSIPPKGEIFKAPLEDYIITQYYGRTSFVKNRPDIYGGLPHNGIDMKAGFGSEVRSIGTGTVLAKGFNNAAGNWVAIRHDNDLVSIYAHMKNPALVLADERVNENTILGFEGATGLATGTHLHLSLYHEFFTFIGPITSQIYFNSWEGSLNPSDYMKL